MERDNKVNWITIFDAVSSSHKCSFMEGTSPATKVTVYAAKQQSLVIPNLPPVTPKQHRPHLHRKPPANPQPTGFTATPAFTHSYR